MSLWFPTLSHAGRPKQIFSSSTNGQKWGRGQLVGPTLSGKGVFEEEEEEEEGAPPTNVTGYNVGWGKNPGPNGTQLLLPLLASGL